MATAAELEPWRPAVIVPIAPGERWCQRCFETVATGESQCSRCGGRKFVDPLSRLREGEYVVRGG